MQFKNLRIGQKIVSIFTIILILIAGVTTYAILSINNLKYLHDESDQRNINVQVIEEFAGMVDNMYGVFVDAIIDSDLEGNKKDWEVVYDDTLRDVEAVRKIVTSEEDRYNLDRASEIINEINNYYSQLIALIQANDSTTISEMDNKVDQLRNEFQITTGKIVNSIHEQAIASNKIFDIKA